MVIVVLLHATFGAAFGWLLARMVTRKPRRLLKYSIAGAIGSSLYTALPLLQGQGYVQGGLRWLAVSSAIATGVAIAFSGARGDR